MDWLVFTIVVGIELHLVVTLIAAIFPAIRPLPRLSLLVNTSSCRLFCHRQLDSIEDGSSLGVELGIDKQGSEDGYRSGIEDSSLLGAKLSLNKGSEDVFKDGCSDGNKDGWRLLGVKIGNDKGAEDGIKEFLAA
jgi:hypothetical protein